MTWQDAALRRALLWTFERFAEGAAHFSKQLWETETMLADRVPIWEEELRQEGEARALLRQLRERFGELPDSVGTRLKSGTREQLEVWTVRLLHSSSLDDLFGAEAASQQ